MKVVYRLIVLVLLLTAGHTMHAQRLITAEYFWDTDPGVGLGTSLTAADGAFDEAIEQIIGNGIGLPSPTGVHTFNIRVRDSYFRWSKKFSVIVDVEAMVINTQTIHVSTAEYFWDTDPGAGNGSLMLAFDGNFDAAMETVFQDASIPSVNGFHILGIRTRDGRNSWGPHFKVVVDVKAATVTTGVIRISAAEFFWDNDPGTGNGTVMLAFDGNFDAAIETVISNAPVSVAAGWHKLNIRLRDRANNWGPVFSVAVEVESSTSSATRQVKVIAGEYFWGTDPGLGNGTPLLAADGTFNGAIEKLIQSIPAPATTGVQKLSVRAKDVANNWGKTFSVNVDVRPTTPATPARKQIAGEYYFNSDPGLGNGTPVMAVDGSFDEAIESILGGGLPGPVVTGVNTLYIRSKDANNRWGKPFGVVVYMDTTVAGISAHINGTDTICANQSRSAISYSTLSLPGLNYTWTVTGGTIVSGAGTPAVVINWSGTAPYKLHVRVCDPVTTECKSDSIDFIVKPLLTGVRSQSICYGTSTLIGGVPRNTSGVYTDTLLGSNGCDSIVTVTLSVIQPIRTTLNPVICFGDSFAGYTATGVYFDTLTAANGCDSIVTTNLTIRPDNVVLLNISICQGYDYEGYTSTGTYVDALTSVAGCDSTRILNLTVNNTVTGTEAKAICSGQSYLGYSSAGTYVDTFNLSIGCDSIRTLVLTVLPPITGTVSQTICQGQSYAGHTTTGVYTDTYTAANGCDSVRTLTLTVLPTVSNTISQTVCYGASYAGYTASGSYTDVFPSSNGCDSTRILNLTVLPQNITAISYTICSGGSYQGYSTAGVYTDVYSGYNGCDSTRVLTLTIGTAITGNALVSICPGDSVWLAGQYRTTAGLYRDTLNASGGCDSILNTTLSVYPQPTTPVILRNGNILTVPDVYDSYIWYQDGYVVAGAGNNGVAFIANGIYHVVVTDNNGCTVSSDTVNVTNVGIDDPEGDFSWQAYPNPTRGRLFVEVTGLQHFGLELYNALGQKLLEVDPNAPQPFAIDMQTYATGIYYVKLISGEQVEIRKVLLSR